MTPEQGFDILEWALVELEHLNRRSLLKDVASRPGFYLALVNDMGLLRHPSQLFSYFTDFVKNNRWLGKWAPHEVLVSPIAGDFWFPCGPRQEAVTTASHRI